MQDSLSLSWGCRGVSAKPSEEEGIEDDEEDNHSHSNQKRSEHVDVDCSGCAVELFFVASEKSRMPFGSPRREGIRLDLAGSHRHQA